jgi:hypothetical protein
VGDSFIEDVGVDDDRTQRIAGLVGHDDVVTHEGAESAHTCPKTARREIEDLTQSIGGNGLSTSHRQRSKHPSLARAREHDRFTVRPDEPDGPEDSDLRIHDD